MKYSVITEIPIKVYVEVEAPDNTRPDVVMAIANKQARQTYESGDLEKIYRAPPKVDGVCVWKTGLREVGL